MVVITHTYQNGSYHTSALENDMMSSPTEIPFMISNQICFFGWKTPLDFLGGHLKDNIVRTSLKSSSLRI